MRQPTLHTSASSTRRAHGQRPGSRWPLLLALLLPLLLGMLLAPTGHAEAALNGAGIVVRHGDGRILYAYVEFSEPSITGMELLRRSGLSVVAAAGGLGESVCMINGEGCGPDNCFCKSYGSPSYYWHYYNLRDGQWRYASVGAGARVVQDGAVDAWDWLGEPGSLPPVTIDDLASRAGVRRGAPASPPTPAPPVPTLTPTPLPPTSTPAPPPPTATPLPPEPAPTVAPTITTAPPTAQEPQPTADTNPRTPGSVPLQPTSTSIDAPPTASTRPAPTSEADAMATRAGPPTVPTSATATLTHSPTPAPAAAAATPAPSPAATASPQARVVAVAGDGPAPDTSRGPASPVPWLGYIGVVVIALGLLGYLGWSWRRRAAGRGGDDHEAW